MKERGLLEYLLMPAGWLYGGVTHLRNLLYDRGVLRQRSFPIPVISVGNITVGGTGKTPHVEYLLQLLAGDRRVAVLSRGYGRITKGYILSDGSSTAATIGDEPNQIRMKYGNVAVAVCEDRCLGLDNLMRDVQPDVVILDDAYQHRRVRPSLNILLVDWNRNIMDDYMLPSGRLRESAAGRDRAHVIVMTKCPASLTQAEMEQAAARIRVNESQEVFFTAMAYDGCVSFLGGDPVALSPATPVLLVTGIARPEHLRDELTRTGAQVSMMEFPDHHSFTETDIRNIASRLDAMGQGAVVVTTQKDQSRLISMGLEQSLAERIAVMPVRVRFLSRGDEFAALVRGHASDCSK